MKKHCIVCSKGFETNFATKTCSKDCWRAHHNKHKSKYRKQSSLGVKIKNHYMKTPTWGTKGLWDGKGYWSKKHDCCEHCLSTIYKHHSGGLCESCYNKFKWQAKSKEEKESASKKRNRTWRKNQHKKEEKKRKEGLKWFRKAESKQIEIDSTILNLIENGL
jgi:hypothetical protein